jgi:hypothetical protein
MRPPPLPAPVLLHKTPRSMEKTQRYPLTTEYGTDARLQRNGGNSLWGRVAFEIGRRRELEGDEFSALAPGWPTDFRLSTPSAWSFCSRGPSAYPAVFKNSSALLGTDAGPFGKRRWTTEGRSPASSSGVGAMIRDSDRAREGAGGDAGHPRLRLPPRLGVSVVLRLLLTPRGGLAAKRVCASP